MRVCRVGLWCEIVISLCLVSFCAFVAAQDSGQSSSSKHTKSSTARLVPEIDAGTVVKGVYRNRALALTCKIPAGWVLRTEEMNARDEKGEAEDTAPDHPQQDKRAGKVLLAAYSRP